MTPKNGTKVYEGELATFWFDEDGILCAVAKTAMRTLEMQKKNYVFLKKITGNKKVCLLSDTTLASPQDKETRDYVAEQMPNYFKAMAIISHSETGQFIATVFTALKDQPVPICFFPGENEAREWLKQYL